VDATPAVAPQSQALAAGACGKVLLLEAGDWRREWPEKLAATAGQRGSPSLHLYGWL